jgi:type II secretory pathway component PulK
MRYYKNSKNKATAIITAVLIVAVVSIAAITMQGYLNGEMNRTKLILDNDILLNKAYDVESWGLARLKQVITENSLDSGNNYKLELSHYNTQLLGKIKNQNGLFNLNYLYNLDICNKGAYDPNTDMKVIIFTRLLHLAEVNTILSDDEIRMLIANIQNWMCFRNDDAINSNINGSNSWSYQKAGQFFIDKSELLLVPGVTREIYNKISRHITVFPIILQGSLAKMRFDMAEITPIIFAAITNIDKVTARGLFEPLRNKTKHEKSIEIKQYLTQQKKTEQESELAAQQRTDIFNTGSKIDSYYTILSRVTSGEYVVQIQSLVHVADEQVNVIWRKQGLHYE